MERGDDDEDDKTPPGEAKGPLPPPPIPLLRRLRGRFTNLLPALIWVAALAGAASLYQTEATHGDVFAFAEVDEVAVTPEIDGVIATEPLEIGQEIKLGEVAATLQTKEIDERIRLARADLEQLPVRLGEALRLELVGSAGDSRLTTFGQDGQRIKVAHEKLSAQQETDRAALAAIGPQLARLKDLVDKKLIPAESMNDLVLKKAILEKTIAARSELIKSSKGRLDVWASEETRLAELRIGELERERAKYRLDAPASGTVELILHHPGEFVIAGTPIAQIQVRRPGRMVAFIADPLIPKIHPGVTATLRVRERPGTSIEARVLSVGPRIEEVPIRLRFVPTVVQWGRRIVLEIPVEKDPLPGEVYSVRFHP
ncbi:MAG: HlyD family efflux transporter periplasmic adaptor subunit [Byssovorax sp.]